MTQSRVCHNRLTSELEVVKTKKEINTNDILGENKIKCDLCEYTASTNTVLKRHVTIKHKFKCELCDTICISQHALKGHTEFKHSAECMQSVVFGRG